MIRKAAAILVLGVAAGGIGALLQALIEWITALDISPLEWLVALFVVLGVVGFSRLVLWAGCVMVDFDG